MRPRKDDHCCKEYLAQENDGVLFAGEEKTSINHEVRFYIVICNLKFAAE